jgi:hypothetical protein
VLFFAIGAHTGDIAGHVNECQRLDSSESNTIENHVAEWQDGIEPELASINDLVQDLARFNHLSPCRQEVARTIRSHVSSMEEHANSAIWLLAGSREGHTQPFYLELLTAMLEDAYGIGRGIEVLWHCGEAAQY